MRLVTMTMLVAVLAMAPLAVGEETKQSPAAQPTACQKEAKAADSAAPGCDAKAPCEKGADKAVGCKGDKDHKTAAGKCDKSADKDAGKCDKKATACKCDKACKCANGDKAECKCTDGCKCGKAASCKPAEADKCKAGAATGCSSAAK